MYRKLEASSQVQGLRDFHFPSSFVHGKAFAKNLLKNSYEKDEHNKKICYVRFKQDSFE